MNGKLKLRKAVTGVLLGFVLVSIGYAIGREVTLHRLAGEGGGVSPAAGEPPAGERVVVHYLHVSQRCATCNAIEAAAREAVFEDLAAPLAAGRVVWRDVNIETNDAFASRYDVATSSVLLVHYRDGREVHHELLDELYQLADDPAAARARVAERVGAMLKAAGAAKEVG